MGVKVALLGDICLTGRFSLEENPNVFEQLSVVKRVLDEHDVVVANLESPFTLKERSLVCKAVHIKSSPSNVKILKYLGVSAVSLANNHIFDYGYDGYNSTVTHLKEAGINHFGDRGQEWLFSKNQEKILFAGNCCLSAHPSRANKKGVNVLSYSKVAEFFENADNFGAFPLLSVHWGRENTHSPSLDHMHLARILAHRKDFVLHGHHPHVVQGLERIKDSVIAYSLGNFCTDEHLSKSIRDLKVVSAPENRESFILSVNVESGKLSEFEIIPIYDDGLSIRLGGKDLKEKILGYSRDIGRINDISSSAQRDEREISNRSLGASRYSLSWFINRLNYHFIGACIKGVINLIRYKCIFHYIQKEARAKSFD